MATTYTSTIQFRCWKAHTCVTCGAVYAYLFSRKVVGSSTSSADQATVNAKAAVDKALENEVDHAACPTCGNYQADMVAQSRRYAHWMAFWVWLVLALVLVVLELAHVMPRDTAVWYAAGGCLAAAVLALLVELRNPNLFTTANRVASERKVQAGAMKLLKAGDETPGGKPSLPAMTVAHMMVLVCLVGMPLVALSPELMRLANGWSVNHECFPPVFGPGDETKVYFGERKSSVKGYWRGKPTGSAVIEGEKRVRPLQVATNQNDWGDRISVKSSEKSTGISPWVTVTFPADPELADKSLACRFDLAMQFPVVDATGNSFSVQSALLNRQLAVQTAAPGAGKVYTQLWWLATCLGMVASALLVLTLMFLAGTMRAYANPTQVFPPDQGTA